MNNETARNPKIRYGTIKRPIIKKKPVTTGRQKIGALIVCDGSFLEDRLCGGIAGTVSIIEPGKPPKEIEFDSVVYGAKNSVVVELYAISAAIKKLKIHASDNNLDVSEIQIFSDSKWGMTGYEKMKNGEYFYPQITPGLKKLDKGLSSFPDTQVSMNYVRAHQNDDVANYIERRHNQIDVRASKNAHIASGYVEKPSKSNAYSAMLPAVVENEKERVELHNLGYAMAKEKLIARVLFDGTSEKVENHPFLDGIRAATSEDGVEYDNWVLDVTEYTPASHTQHQNRLKHGTMEDFCYRRVAAGIETAKLKAARHEARQSGKEFPDKRRYVEPYRIAINTDNAAMAGESVRLLHGRSKLAAFQRVNIPPFMTLTKFVVDMTGTMSAPSSNPSVTPKTRGDWVRKMKDMHSGARVPVLSNVQAAFAQERSAKAHLFSCDEALLKETITDVLEDYMGVLSPEQIESKINAALGGVGINASSSAIKSAVCQASIVDLVADRILSSCAPTSCVGQAPEGPTANSEPVEAMDFAHEADGPTARVSI